MRSTYLIIILCSVVFLYALIFNIVAFIVGNEPGTEIIDNNLTENIDERQIDFGDSVSVKVTKASRWYGRTENFGNVKYLRLFDVFLIPLPYKIRDTNTLLVHFGFLALIIFILSVMIVVNRDERRNYEDEAWS